MQAKAEEPAKSDTTGSDFESCSSDEAQAHAADGADPHSSPVSPLWSPAKPVDRVAEESPSLDGLLSQLGLQSLGPVLEENEVDAALAHMVLHYLPSPSDAIREMARIVKPGGHLVIVEFVSHALDWMEQELGVIWKGFASDTIRDWFSAAGLVEIEIEESESLAQERDLPSTFIASARVPSGANGSH